MEEEAFVVTQQNPLKEEDALLVAEDVAEEADVEAKDHQSQKRILTRNLTRTSAAANEEKKKSE
jgi:hypothetical protein